MKTIEQQVEEFVKGNITTSDEFRIVLQERVRIAIEETEIAIMTEAHKHAISDDTPYPKITLQKLAEITGGSYHSRLKRIKDIAKLEGKK